MEKEMGTTIKPIHACASTARPRGTGGTCFPALVIFYAGYHGHMEQKDRKTGSLSKPSGGPLHAPHIPYVSLGAVRNLHLHGSLSLQAQRGDCSSSEASLKSSEGPYLSMFLRS